MGNGGSQQITTEMIKEIAMVSLMGLVAWAYQATRPLPPKPCGSPSGPPITSPRIKLHDGRHLAYKEHGVSKQTAKYKIVFVHGMDATRHDVMIATPPEILEELGVYVVSFDRAGYGESDPDAKRTIKSCVLDVEELADQLELGPKFYLVGFSLGGMIVWGCLKHIPHRLAGVALLAPAINYWWPGFPANLSKEAYDKLLQQDQWALRVSHYAPWLTHWWNTQKLFPPFSIAAHEIKVLSHSDIEIVSTAVGRQSFKEQARQQGELESIHRDLTMGFGKWEFDPMELDNPFPDNEGSVHLWQGDEDRLVPSTLQRCITNRLPWIHYHELSGAGHLFPCANGINEMILKTFLPGHK